MSSVTFEVGKDSVRFLDGDNGAPTKPCGVLLLFLLIAVTLNSLIVIGVFRSYLRSHVFNFLLASMCLSLIVDSITNLTIATIVRASWTDLYRQLSDDLLVLLCQFNSSCMMLPLILQSIHLALLSVHRSSVLGISSKQALNTSSKPSNHKNIKRLGLLSWTVAQLMVLPISLGAVGSRHYEQRYSCSPAYVTKDTAAMCISIIILALGICLPWTVIVQYWALLILRVLRERQRLQTLELVALQRAAARSSPLRGLGSPLSFSVPPWSQIWGPSDSAAGEGFRFFILCGLLVGTFLTLLLPHLITVQVYQFYDSYSLVHDHKPLLFGNATIHLPNDFKPIETPKFDNTFLWFRVFYPMAVPILILTIHNEIRKQSLAILNSCRGKESNLMSSHADSVSGYLVSRKRLRRRRRKSKYKNFQSETVPVLFATNDGIHLRTFAVERAAQDFTTSISASWRMKNKFECSFMDLYGKLQTTAPVPKLSDLSPQVPNSTRSSLLEHDLEEHQLKTRKGGKTVRFSQRVSEIPLGDSGVSSDADSAVVIVRPIPELNPPAAKWQQQLQVQQRRASIPFTRFPSQEDVLNVHSKKSLELDIANNSSMNSSSSSLLLTLSQRMRSRDS